jgi:DNA-directed RNA polymerase specialized sigma24 family protein
MADEWMIAAVAKFEKPLQHYATKFLGDGHRAADLVQDAFAIRHRAQTRPLAVYRRPSSHY